MTVHKSASERRVFRNHSAQIITSGSSESSNSTNSSSNSSSPLRRFNRLLVSSLSRHWSHLRKRSLRRRHRSVSDSGLCSRNRNDPDMVYLDLPAASSQRSLQLFNMETTRDHVPALFITSAGTPSSVVGAEEGSDGSDVERPKRSQHLRVPTPAFPGQSTGNFAAGAAGGGCGAPRSAPATPLQIEPHPRNTITKHDKNATKNLSNLSGSVPSVRPPSSTGTAADAGDVKQQYKSRQKKFQRHFPQVGPDERVLNYYACALVGDLLLQGHLYITKNYFAFYSNVFGYVTKLLIPTISVLRISKEKVARIIPNAVGVCTRDERHVFGSLLSRDSTYKLMVHVWKAARTPELSTPQAQELRASEVELDASEYSPEDDSSSLGGDPQEVEVKPLRRESEGIITAGAGGAVIQPALLAGGVSAAAARPRWWRPMLVCCAVLLAICAAMLAHALYRVRTAPQVSKLSGEELYTALVRWRAQMHGRAADELHDFLSANLLLLSKVRQSLEALSGVILTDMAQAGNIDIPNETFYS